jgi:hypothetical protein
MDEQERFELLVKIADQLEWLANNHESFQDDVLAAKIRGLWRLQDQIDPGQVILSSQPKIDKLIADRKLRI